MDFNMLWYYFVFRAAIEGAEEDTDQLEGKLEKVSF